MPCFVTEITHSNPQPQMHFAQHPNEHIDSALKDNFIVIRRILRQSVLPELLCPIEKADCGHYRIVQGFYYLIPFIKESES